MRHVSKEKRDILVKRVVACFEAAAAATGCTVKVALGFDYDNLVNNGPLCSAYQQVTESLYKKHKYAVTLNTHIGGSTDFVIYFLPSSFPLFSLELILWISF